MKIYHNVGLLFYYPACEWSDQWNLSPEKIKTIIKRQS